MRGLISLIAMLLVALVLYFGFSAGQVHAQSGSLYDLTWSTFTGTSQGNGGNYSIDAMFSPQSTITMSGGLYTVGNPWSTPGFRVNLPVVRR
jgi:hypothetical protein